MSLGYNSKSIIGGSLNPKVLDQLSARKAVIKKRNDRTTDDILYLNSTTGWVKMTSAVDVYTEDDINGNPVYSNDTSKKNVLLGGTQNSGSIQGGIFNDTDNAYKKSDMLGYRPMAGITGFKVNSKNTFGTLRVATVDFKANSIEQLDDLEQLFLRPGFSVLLEWGHSLYLDNKGSLQKTIKTFPDFFTGQSSEGIYNKIKELQESSNYNYDAMYGFIKNFAWSYNLDGGYDCKVDLVSRGELIESLDILVPPLSSTDDPKEIDDSYTPEKWTTSLHLMLYIINEMQPLLFGRDSQNSDEFNEAFKQTKLSEGIYNTLKTNLEISGRKFKVKNVSFLKNKDSKDTTWSKYIQLGVLLELINTVFLLDDNRGIKIVKFNTGGIKIPLLPSNKNTPFFTFTQHFAIDPFICILPKQGTHSLPSVNPNQTTKFGYNIAMENAELKGGESEILNIYLNVDYILDCWQSTSEGSDKNVVTFVKSILNGMNETLGYINDLDIHYEEEETTYYIVDRKVTPSKEDLANSNIDLVGLNSMLENLSFTSKVSANISSMIAIAAQASSTNAGLDILNMQTWGAGLQDRHLATKSIGKKTNNEDKDEEEIKSIDIKKFIKWLKIVNSSNTIPNSSWIDRESVSAFAAVHKYIMTKASDAETKFVGTNPGGLIPFELSFTMAGIAGIRIGQAFTIPDSILPERYRGNIAFLVTHVDHSIKNNRWITDIQTQMIVANKFVLEENKTNESTEAILLKLSETSTFKPSVNLPSINPLEYQVTQDATNVASDNNILLATTELNLIQAQQLRELLDVNLNI